MSNLPYIAASYGLTLVVVLGLAAGWFFFLRK